MSTDERPRGSARPTPQRHRNSLPSTSLEGVLERRLRKPDFLRPRTRGRFLFAGEERLYVSKVG
jgi:hypothetical protein